MAAFSTILEFPNTLEPVTCCVCGVQFAFPATLYRKKLEDKTRFFCPNGHEQHFVGKSEVEKLREQLERERREHQAALETERQTTHSWRSSYESAENSRRATKAQLTKVKNRVANGVCPCCKRTFTNLRQHMSRQHPDFNACEKEPER